MVHIEVINREECTSGNLPPVRFSFRMMDKYQAECVGGTKKLSTPNLSRGSPVDNFEYKTRFIHHIPRPYLPFTLLLF